MKRIKYLNDLDAIENNGKSRTITIKEWYIKTSMELLRLHLNSVQLTNYLDEASKSLLDELKMPDEIILEEV